MLSGGPRNLAQVDQSQFVSSLPLQFQQQSPGGQLSTLLVDMQKLFDDFGKDLSLGALNIAAGNLDVTSALQESQIAALQTQTSNLQSSVTALQGQVTSSAGLIGTLQSQVQINQNAITVLQTQIVTANDLILSANAAIAALQQQLTLDEQILASLQATSATQTQIDQLQAQIDTNTDTIANIQATILVLQGQISTNQSAIQQLTSSVQTANQAIDDLETSDSLQTSAIGALESSVNSLNATTQTLQGQINTTNSSLATAVGTNTLQDSSIGALQSTASFLVQLTQTQGDAIDQLNTDIAAINVSPADLQQIQINKQNIANQQSSIDTNTNTLVTLNATVMTVYQHVDSHLIYGNGPGVLDTAYNYQNRVPGFVTADELLTWGFMKLFIDALFPIGCVQLTLNTMIPNSFNGYIQWDRVPEADGRYLRLFGGGNNGGFTVGTQAAGSVLAHNHQTPAVTLPSYQITTGNNTTFSATTSYHAGGAGATKDAVGTSATAGNFTAPPDAVVFNFTPHTHTLTVPSQTLASLQVSSTGSATNECNSFTVAIYKRIA